VILEIYTENRLRLSSKWEGGVCRARADINGRARKHMRGGTGDNVKEWKTTGNSRNIISFSILEGFITGDHDHLRQ